jgi:hypothetical protein
MSAPSASALLVRHPRAAVRRRAGVMASHIVLLGLALIAWIAALKGAHVGRISGYGLLPALPASYYVALAALGIGFVTAVAQRSSPPALLAVYVLALILLLHATTPLLYSEPRYAWTYKHLGVTEYISHFGTTDRSIDLYQNWPAFFALAGLLQHVSGVSLAAMAPWAEAFFEAANVLAIVFLLGGVTRERRIVWTAAWLFVLANWLGQDYFAPQSFAYLLSLVLLGLCVRCAPAARQGPGRWSLSTRWWQRLERLAAGRRMPFLDDADSAPLRPMPALLVGGLLFAVVTMSHQLSPLLCIVAVGAFAATTRRIGVRPLLAMLVLELGWLIAAAPLLTSKYHLLDLSPLERPVSLGGNSAWALPGLDASVLAARASVALVAVLALASLWRRRRAGHFDLPLLAIVLAPLLVLGVQAYNGEGVFRVYLFALPWLCFLAATLLVSRAAQRASVAPGEAPAQRQGSPSVSSGLRILALASTTALLGGAFLFASFGREIVNYVTPQDVAIARAYERDAPPGSAVVYLAPNVPNHLTYRYADKQVWAGSFAPALTEDPSFRGHALGFGDIGALEAKLRALQATQAYVMIGPSEVKYVRAFGLLPPGSVDGLIAALRASSDFQLVAQDGEALLFRLNAPAGS